jgi:hypothetical protein
MDYSQKFPGINQEVAGALVLAGGVVLLSVD